MKKVLSLFFNRWTMALLGLLAISLLIWYVGPLFAMAEYYPLESTKVRGLLIGLVILLYLTKILWGIFKAKRWGARLMDSLARQAAQDPKTAPTSGPGDEEIGVLSQRFQEALSILKKTQASRHGKTLPLLFWKRQQYIYELPWYIFIGAPGSGKTTALINSGLQFPLAEQFGQEPIRGVGGTRNCDWWFTNEAVLIDTAGRYTTQESNQEVDRSAWSGFLQLLKKYRPRRPINGIIVTISVADLLQQNKDGREAQAAAVRKRIQELYEELGLRFPIYVLVTKSDLLAGFMEFFADCGKEDRAQVWGTTFPIEQASGALPLADFEQQFLLLEQRLNNGLLDRLQQERDPQRRALIYAFPAQFHQLKRTLNEFLSAVFTPSRFEQAPLLRGVYFASGTQEGSPIDRVMGTLARALHLERKLLLPAKPSGKSFFLTHLIGKIIIPEAGLVGTNLRWERRRALMQMSGYVLAGIVLAVALSLWAISYSQNKQYIAEVDTQARAIATTLQDLSASTSTDVVGLLPLLDSMRGLATTSSLKEAQTPWTMGFGLAQVDKLNAATNFAYERLLKETLLARLALHLEQRLRSGGDNPELLYEQLKTYVMLSDSRHFDADAIQAFITADWEASLTRDVTVEQRQRLELHLRNLLASSDVSTPLIGDKQLVEQVRNSLLQTPLAQRAYNRLKRQRVGADLPEFTVANKAGPAAALAFTRSSGLPLTAGVPGLYTYDGYHKVFRDAAEEVANQLAEEEEWVLGTKPGEQRTASAESKARLIEEVQRLYLQDYVRIWDALIKDVKLIGSGSLQQSIDLARVISAPDSPLPQLLRAIVREVTLVKVGELDKTLIDKAGDRLQGARTQITKLFGAPPQLTPTSSLVSRPERIVDDHFDYLRRLVQAPAAGMPAPIDGTLALVNELYTQLTATQIALNSGATPPLSDIATKIKAEAQRAPEPMRSMLTTLSSQGGAQTMAATRKNLGASLNANVGNFCNQAIAGRYPFVKSSTQDVTQEDFARLFASGGLIDDFFQKNLAQYVDTATRPWSFRKTSDGTTPGPASMLEEFRRAQAIREVFFPNGRPAGIRVEFKPIEMDAAITQLILDVDGQLVKYSHGPQTPTSVQWPSPRSGTQVRLQISPPSVSGPSAQVLDGPWALFRLFDRAQITPMQQPEKFTVTFNVDGRQARFDVSTSSVQNPFRMREFEQFRCPDRL